MDSTPSTKDKILKAARDLFAAHGFAGTSMGNIAKKARVNHSLLFHHFGNKEKLWVAVKQATAEKCEADSQLLPSVEQPFPQFIAQLFDQQVAFYHNHPEITRMIGWQRLEIEHKAKIGVTPSRVMLAWIEAFEHYQQTGQIDHHANPAFMVIYVLSIIHSAAVDRNAYTAKAKDFAAYRQFCIQQIVSGLSRKAA